MKTGKPVMLMILDGFGLNDRKEGNAVAMADTPFLDHLMKDYPMSSLGASGMEVGLPDGQMGNSEVGHLNIGAGRVVYQELSRITREIEKGDFYRNSVLLDAVRKGAAPGKAVHVMGLLSDGGVHSHIDHLKGIIDMAAAEGVNELYIHAFLDGRDVPPRCALKYIVEIERYMEEKGTGRIATVCGRYYAMDRDSRWERVEKAYRCIAEREGISAETAEEAVEMAYGRDENDEFVQPTLVKGSRGVEDGDSIIMFNFRPDRAREITRAFSDPDFAGFERRKAEDLTYVCMCQYDSTMPCVSVAYPPESIKNTLGEYVSSAGLKQLRIAETEKYAHVTFFFNGGTEEPWPGEERKLIASPKVATYDMKPEMSAVEVTDAVIDMFENYDLTVLNFANADMVGHTGIMEAAVKAVETLDVCVKRITEKVLDAGGSILLTADHGNADVMEDQDGNVVTAHSLNRVPAIYISERKCALRDGNLADIAPTVLEMLGLEKPEEMTGNSLFVR